MANTKLEYSKILEILKNKIDNSIDDIPYENASSFKGEEVEYESRSGFIPYTDGGYEAIWFEYVDMISGSGASLPTKPLDEELQRQVNYNYEVAKESFIEKYPEIVEELGEDAINYSDLYEAGYSNEAEELSEMEMQYSGEDTILMRVFAYYYSPENSRSENGKHTISLQGDVNLESPYHRVGNLDDGIEIRFTFTSIQDLSKKMDTNLKKIVDWFNGDSYSKSKSLMKIRRMDEGGEADSEREDSEREDERDEANERLEELMQEHDLPREVIEEYQSVMGREILDIDELPFSGRYDSEEDFAEDLVEQGAISNLSYYLEMTSLDMRLLAQEEADARVDDMSDDEILDAMDMEDEANEYNELKDEIDNLESDVDDLKSQLDDYLDDEEDLTEGEMEMREERGKDFRDEIDEKENELENLQHKLASLDTYDEVVDKAREQLRDVYYDDIHDELERDAVGYFVDNLGYAEEDLAKNNLFRVDYEKLASDLSHDYTIIEHGGDVYVFASYMGGGMTYAKGGVHNVNKKYAYFAVNKKTNKIIDGWEIVDDVESLKYYAKMDLKDNDLNPSDYSLLSAKALKSRGIDPYSWDSWAKTGEYGDGGYMAKGGMTEHGLRNGDKIISGKIIGTTIIVHNDNANEHARVDLNTGKRTILTYNQKTNKWEEKMADGGYMAKGGSTDRGIDKFFVEDEKTKFGYVIKVNKKDKGLSTISYHKTKAEANKECDRLNKDSGTMAKGGATFDDKVKSIKKRLEGMSVAPKYRKEYGKTYDKSEALSAAKAIAGSMRAKEMSKKKS